MESLSLWSSATLGMGGHTGADPRPFPARQGGGHRPGPAGAVVRRTRLERFGPLHASTPCTTTLPTPPRWRAWQRVDGILFDLGVSSLQLDERDRGFAYSFDAPTTCAWTSRPSHGLHGGQRSTRGQLRDMIYRWGEDRFAPRIARAIVAARTQAPRTRRPARGGGALRRLRRRAAQEGYPAKQTFQALRIEVNEELDVLELGDPRGRGNCQGGRACRHEPPLPGGESSEVSLRGARSRHPGLPRGAAGAPAVLGRHARGRGPTRTRRRATRAPRPPGRRRSACGKPRTRGTR
ncbi:16S rRNA (cytosine(1402)-N(4))-methyltransferase [Kocuria rhizophila]|nr:16S rRNA (cytosine(1402)-N(4))-methyltransferase [Kocuria rhizophila]